MKKLVASFLLFIGFTATYGQNLPTAIAIAQKVLPTFQFGIKAGTNLTRLSSGDTFNSNNQAGFLFGVWSRIGIASLQLQPEMYYTTKNVALTDINGQTNSVNFTSIDVPVLIDHNFGLLGFGGHFNTGPVVSFVVDKNQSLSGAFDKISKFDYRDQALAWQFGLGLDLRKYNVNLRYELGLSSLSKDDYPDTKIRMFNLSVGYRLF